MMEIKKNGSLIFEITCFRYENT